MAAGAVLPGPAIAYVADEVLGAALEPPVARDVLSTVVGVQASDGKLTSQEALVDFAFLAEADYEAKPVAGGVGNALHLYAGIKEPAVECSLPAGTIVDSSEPFTLSVWFKTNRPLDSCNAGATLVSFGVNTRNRAVTTAVLRTGGPAARLRRVLRHQTRERHRELPLLLARLGHGEGRERRERGGGK